MGGQSRVATGSRPVTDSSWVPPRSPSTWSKPMLEPVSVGLKFAFLAVLYLFLLWVARSALRDLRRGVGEGSGGAPAVAPPDATGLHAASRAGGGDIGTDGRNPRLVVEAVPGHEAGMEYDIDGGATLGRGDVEIHLEDGFASSRHARLLP